MRSSRLMIYQFLFFLIGILPSQGCGNGRSRGDENSPPIFIKIPGQFDNAAEREAIRADNKKLVRSCYNSVSTLNSSVTKEVDYRAYETTSGSEGGYWLVRYGVKKNTITSNISINLNIALTIGTITTELNDKQRELLGKVRSCVPKIENVFARYGIDFSMQLDPRLDERTDTHHFYVTLKDEVGRSTTAKWYVGPPMLENDSLCKIMLHEVGHYLSLDDEYIDTNYPNRTFISEEKNSMSIMNSTAFGFEYSDFYPRHIKSMLTPICPDYAIEQGWKFHANAIL